MFRYFSDLISVIKEEFNLKLKIILSVLFAAAVCTGFSAISADAAEKNADGVTLILSADKADYGAGEQITAGIRLENRSDSDITDITLKADVPAHYHSADGAGTVLRSTYLMAGDTVGSDLVFIPDAEADDSQTDQASAAAAEKSPETQRTETASAGKTQTAVTEAAVDRAEPQEKTHRGGIIAAAALLTLLCGGAVLTVKKRRGRNLLIILCIVAAGAGLPKLSAEAAEPEVKTLTVTETVTAADRTIELTATVTFTVEYADMQAAVAEYYEDNSEQIVAVEKVEDEAEVFSEKEALAFLAERGFTDYPLTYDYNMDGTYTDEAEASADSDEKHPMYQTYYVSADNAIWTVFLVGRTITANPASYNLESDLDAQVLVSETETLTSYTEMGNKLYTTIPKESAVRLKIVDQITSRKLNELTFEEVIGQ